MFAIFFLSGGSRLPTFRFSGLVGLSYLSGMLTLATLDDETNYLCYMAKESKEGRITGQNWRAELEGRVGGQNWRADLEGRIGG